MKAARIHGYGQAFPIVIDEIDIPEPGPGQVVVRVAATTFNPVENYLHAGMMVQYLQLDFPFTFGLDISGTVTALGDGVDSFAVGDAVVGFLPPAVGGGAAEYAAVPAALLNPAPSSVSATDAAALPMVGLTAYQMLFEHAHIESGQRVLVNGAGGAVGSIAVQLAHNTGATVIATASPRSAGRVTGYGADQVIDYTAPSIAAAISEQVDVLINVAFIGEGQAADMLTAVRDGGVVVSATAGFDTMGRPITVIMSGTHPQPADLAALVRDLDAGALALHIEGVHPLTEMTEIHQRAMTGGISGKALFDPAL